MKFINRINTFAFPLLTALLLTAPAAAAVELPVTTSETDSGLPSEYVVIVDPDDGAVLQGNPDAVVQVVLEYEVHLADPPTLRLDDSEEIGTCHNMPSPCTLEATIPPGVHTLTASIGVDDHTVTVEVQPVNETTGGETDTGSSSSEGNPTSSGATGDPGTSGSSGSTGSGSSGSDGAATSGDGGGDKGCACSTDSAPDVLALALAALALPWRRRRNR